MSGQIPQIHRRAHSPLKVLLMSYYLVYTCGSPSQQGGGVNASDVKTMSLLYSLGWSETISELQMVIYRRRLSSNTKYKKRDDCCPYHIGVRNLSYRSPQPTSHQHHHPNPTVHLSRHIRTLYIRICIRAHTRFCFVLAHALRFTRKYAVDSFN